MKPLLLVIALITSDRPVTLITLTNGNRIGVTHGLTMRQCSALIASHREGRRPSAADRARASAIFATEELNPPPKTANPSSIRDAGCVP